MKINLPFGAGTVYLGKKDATLAKQRVVYGAYQNSMSDMLSNADAYRVGFETLYNIFNNVVDVKSCIKKRQMATAKEGYKLVNARDESLLPDQREVQLVNEVLNNTRSPFNRWKNNWVRDRLVSGNHFLFPVKDISGNPVYITSVDPRTMTVVSDKYGNVIKYIQRIAGQDTTVFDKNEIIHTVADYSTSNPIMGVSPIESIVWEARGEMAAQTTNYYFYENGGVPAHLLIVEEELADEQLAKIKQSMDENFRGSKNRFKAGLIPFVKDIRTIAMSQKDMEYLETRKFSTIKVCSAFGVDPFLLGYTEGVQRSNASIIRKDFYESVIRPEELELAEVVNTILFPLLGVGNIKFKVLESNYDDEKTERELARYEVLAGMRTINEAREVLGLSSSDNSLADELMFNGTLIDDLGNEANQLALKTIESTLEKKRAMENLLSHND